MEILRYFTKEELKLLMQINIIIENKKYDETKLKELYKKIYKKGYIDTNVTYAEAEKYKNLEEKYGKDLNEVSKYYELMKSNN